MFRSNGVILLPCLASGFLTVLLAGSLSENVRAEEGENPYRMLAFIHQRICRPRIEGNRICLGALVMPQVVITAAHCFYDESVNSYMESENFFAVLNITTISYYGIKDIVYREPRYNPSTSENDIALVFLDMIPPINTSLFNFANLKFGTLPADTLCHVYFHSFKEDNYSLTIQRTYVVTQFQNACENRNGFDNKKLLPGMLCAGSQFHRSGPCCNKVNNAILICLNSFAGILTRASSSRKTSNYGVYTDVLSHRSWIIKKLTPLGYQDKRAKKKSHVYGFSDPVGVSF